MAMVGGCPGKFICDAHHMAWRLDGLIDLVAGCFSCDQVRNSAAGEHLGLDPDRIYANYEALIAGELSLPSERRAQLIASVTPNQLHAPVALAALRHGFPVISDKPLSYSLSEARELAQVVRETGLDFALTHTYNGYPMVKQAHELLASGRLGKVLRVAAEYPQAGVAHGLAAGRAAALKDPGKRTEVSGCFSDIGVHAAQMLEYISGERIQRLCADSSSIVPGRELDDDANCLLRLSGGGKGVLFASQLATGEENPLAVRVWCEHAGLEWRQMEPGSLVIRWRDRPMEIRRAGRYFDEDLPLTRAATRLPAGHPEGYIEAFATIYAKMARVIHARAVGKQLEASDLDLPGITDGVRGMTITQAVFESSQAEGAWVTVTE